MMSDEENDNLDDILAPEDEDQDLSEDDEYFKKYDEKYARSQELKIANTLLRGTPAAKQEIIVQLILLGNLRALNSVLLAMNDPEYRRVMPTA